MTSPDKPSCACFYGQIMKRFPTIIFLAWSALPSVAGPEVELLPETDPAGYLVRLLINESAFPGERGYRSEEDTRMTMRALLLVVDARIHQIPQGYTREEVSETGSTDVIDVITAGGRRGQIEGFYRDRNGRPVVSPRVTARIANLVRIATQGPPDRFARLLAYAQTLATDYLAGKKPSPDLYAKIIRIPPKNVTGRAYGWMTDQDYYHPGGDFVRIPDHMRGRLGGNRFYTLARRSDSAGAKASPRKALVTVPTPTESL